MPRDSILVNFQEKNTDHMPDWACEGVALLLLLKKNII